MEKRDKKSLMIFYAVTMTVSTAVMVFYPIYGMISFFIMILLIGTVFCWTRSVSGSDHQLA